MEGSVSAVMGRMDRLQQLLVRPGATIKEAMQRIDTGRAAIALQVDADGRLLGAISDGDVRRALLGGATLDDPVDPYVTRAPVVVRPGADRVAVLDLMRARLLSQVPEVDDDGRLVGLHVLHEVLGASAKPNPALILAGGRGTRLGELTAHTPKPMLPVAGRPILERQVLHLVGSGIRRIHLSVGYLSEQIEDHFGDGSAFGCEIVYLREQSDRPLGTGGPLRLLHDLHGTPPAPVLVMNGDLIAAFSVRDILAVHADAGAAITLAVNDYRHEVPYGVVELDDETGLVRRVVEKPRWFGAINAGIYVVEPRLLAQVPADTCYPITDLLDACLTGGERVAAWRLSGEWHDVGRPQELAQARGER